MTGLFGELIFGGLRPGLRLEAVRAGWAHRRRGWFASPWRPLAAEHWRWRLATAYPEGKGNFTHDLPAYLEWRRCQRRAS